MAKVMRELDGTGTWEAAWDLLHVLVDNDVPTFRVDDHTVLIESPRIELRSVMLISTLAVIHFDAIIFLDKGFFVAATSELWVTFCSRTLSLLVAVHRTRLRACLQSGVPVDGSIPRWSAGKPQSDQPKGTWHRPQKKLRACLQSPIVPNPLRHDESTYFPGTRVPTVKGWVKMTLFFPPVWPMSH